MDDLLKNNTKKHVYQFQNKHFTMNLFNINTKCSILQTMTIINILIKMVNIKIYNIL